MIVACGGVVFIILTWRTEATGKIVHHSGMDVKKRKTSGGGCMGVWGSHGVWVGSTEARRKSAQP